MSAKSSLAADLERAADAVRAKSAGGSPAIGVVLGSGLGAFVDALQDAQRIPYAEIPGMPASSVQGHAGNLVLGKHAGSEVAVLQGRAHVYEGHTPALAVFGVRLLWALGARTVILTNASGGIRSDFAAGDIMVIEDQLNLTGRSCLEGPNDELLGPRFVPMNDAYDPELRKLAQRVASGLGIALKSGVYAGVLGPSYETPAEIRMLRTLGGDAVGMSTVLETLALRHLSVRCLGLSCVTNPAAGLSPKPPDHAEVQAAAAAMRDAVNALLLGIVAALAP
jgi:purine-nucleoside phosphorylase